MEIKGFLVKKCNAPYLSLVDGTSCSDCGDEHVVTECSTEGYYVNEIHYECPTCKHTAHYEYGHVYFVIDGVIKGVSWDGIKEPYLVDGDY